MYLVYYLYGGAFPLLLKKRKPGRQIDDMTVGEKLTLTEKIEDKDLLLYLGLTNDANPLYIQHDYASQTDYKKPVVPGFMLMGIVTSAVSKYLPGPGSYITSQTVEFTKPVYHYGTVKFLFEVIDVIHELNLVKIRVEGENEKGETVMTCTIGVCPPKQTEARMDGSILENF